MEGEKNFIVENIDDWINKNIDKRLSDFDESIFAENSANRICPLTPADRLNYCLDSFAGLAKLWSHYRRVYKRKITDYPMYKENEQFVLSYMLSLKKTIVELLGSLGPSQNDDFLCPTSGKVRREPFETF